MPEKIFDGLIHGNILTANILINDGEMYLINIASVVKLSIEYDLLYANRILTSWFSVYYTTPYFFISIRGKEF